MTSATDEDQSSLVLRLGPDSACRTIIAVFIPGTILLFFLGQGLPQWSGLTCLIWISYGWYAIACMKTYVLVYENHLVVRSPLRILVTPWTDVKRISVDPRITYVGKNDRKFVTSLYSVNPLTSLAIRFTPLFKGRTQLLAALQKVWSPSRIADGSSPFQWNVSWKLPTKLFVFVAITLSSTVEIAALIIHATPFISGK
jgi:hypothetical protein